MSRTLSGTMIAAIFAQETGEIPLMLLEISHTDIDTIRLVNNTEDVTSNGDLYTAYPFRINIPPVDSNDEIPRAQVTIDNIDLTIVQTVRSIASAPDVKAAIILESTPDDIEAGWYEFTLKDVDYNAIEISGMLGFEEILNEMFPAGRF